MTILYQRRIQVRRIILLVASGVEDETARAADSIEAMCANNKMFALRQRVQLFMMV